MSTGDTVGIPADLDGIRDEIDTLDLQLLALMSRRGQLAAAAGAIKRQGDAGDVYRPEREARLLRRIAQQNPGPIPDGALLRVFTELVSACRALELPMTVAFLGPQGTYTEAAALKHFGHGVQTSPVATIDSVFRDVESGNCAYGVVPVENSTEGMVSHTLDMFLQSQLTLCGEVLLPIQHCLLSHCAAADAVTVVYSHQQSLGQCRKWLDANLPGVRRQAVSSNAEAARMAASEPGSAAIAGRVNADLYGLPVLAANIEDEPGNTTRFLVISKAGAAASGDDKTSMVFSFRNRPGGLCQAIEVFASRGIDMTRIESRPSRLERWNYVFYVDVEGHRTDEQVSQALEELAARVDYLKIVGSFPRAPREE
jgi:chorismate mutase/prephenate dehydratase